MLYIFAQFKFSNVLLIKLIIKVKNVNPNLSNFMSIISLFKPVYVKIFIVIIYVVGIIGTLLAPQLFQPLTAPNLILTTFILLIFGDVKNRNFWIFTGFIFLAGLFIEILGVKTGKIFGVYYYGEALGLKFAEVPLTIGLNWIFLSLSSLSISQSITKNKIASSFIGAILMVFLDSLIEPLCSKLDYWYWQNDLIPIQNFIAWFIISFVFNYIGSQIKFNKYNSMAMIIFVLQIAFFICLHLANFLT